MTRKTKKEKLRARARHGQFATPTFTFVKREFDTNSSKAGSVGSINKQQEKTGQMTFLASSGRDLFKTLLIASIIFAIELVLYFVWK